MSRGPSDLQRRRSRETRDEIQRAAVELFLEQGVDETTAAQIAQTAGVSQRTFFRYFPTKELAGLPGQSRLSDAIEDVTLVADDADGLFQQLLEVLEQQSALLPALEADHLLLLFNRHPGFGRIAAGEEELIARRIRDVMLASNEWLTIGVASMITHFAIALWRAGMDEYLRDPSVSPAEHFRRLWRGTTIEFPET